MPLEILKENNFFALCRDFPVHLSKASLNLHGPNEVTQHHPVIKQTKRSALIFQRALQLTHLLWVPIKDLNSLTFCISLSLYISQIYVVRDRKRKEGAYQRACFSHHHLPINISLPGRYELETYNIVLNTLRILWYSRKIIGKKKVKKKKIKLGKVPFRQ